MACVEEVLIDKKCNIKLKDILDYFKFSDKEESFKLVESIKTTDSTSFIKYTAETYCYILLLLKHRLFSINTVNNNTIIFRYSEKELERVKEIFVINNTELYNLLEKGLDNGLEVKSLNIEDLSDFLYLNKKTF